ncbi:hypothetical protein, partial [Bacteroides bouchesdurhonensis]|uniref:hypothetical protein n=1 Tax=Bacteroides bouchesdurhonensis TaxID=1841855 RepID=UPI0022E76C79
SNDKQNIMRYLIYNIPIYQLNMNACSYQIPLQGEKRQKSDQSKLTSEEYSFFQRFRLRKRKY